LGRSDGIGHPRAARSERLGLAGGRFASGLMLHLGVNLGADQTMIEIQIQVMNPMIAPSDP
jgi:hypothetical protein